MLSPEQRVELQRRLEGGESPTSAARAMGLHHSSAVRFRDRMAIEAGQGTPFAMPPGHAIKGTSVLLDDNGIVRQRWVKTRAEPNPVDAVEAIKAALVDFEPRAPFIAPPAANDNELLTLIPCNDWHINLLAWEGETSENWDLKLADETIGKAVEEVIGRSPPSAYAVVLGGGDLLHADNQENKTARSGNVLDCDGRYAKGLMVASRLMVRTVDAALHRHQNVIVRILKGNHDEHSAVAIAYFLLAWYRDEPRVTVDVDQSVFWWFRFGSVMLGGCHGHTTKPHDLAGIMAHRRAEDWGATKHRYIHTFHLHHSAKYATEGQGVITEVHQAPVPQDAWHFASGFLSGRSLQAITYHQRFGEVSRARVAIMDAAAA